MVDFSPNSTSEAFNRGLASTGVGGRSIFSSDNQDGQSGPSPEIIQSFKDAAVKYDVPVDVLMGMAEKDSNFNAFNRTRGPGPKVRGLINVGDEEVSRGESNPYEPSQNIDTAARKLRSYLDAGMSVQDAVKAHAGGSDPSKWTPEVDAYGQDVLSRTQRLVDSYLPELKPRVIETETKINPATGKPEPITAEEAGKMFGIAPPEPTVAGNVSDVATLLAKGTSGAIQDANEVVHMVPGVGSSIDALDRAIGGKTLAERGKEIDAKLEKRLSPEMAEAKKKQWLDDNYRLGDAWGDWRSYVGGITESLPETALTSIPVMRMAKGIYAARIASGATSEAAAAAAANAATVSGAASEGLLGGGSSKRGVEEKIRELPIETLRQSDAFKSLVASGMSEDKARESLAKDQGAQAFILGTIATGAFSGVGDRILAKTFLGHMGEDGVKGYLTRLGKASVSEGLFEEMPQSAGQQVAENYAMRGANPQQSLMEGVPNQAVGGAVMGAAMGAGTGAAFEGSGGQQPSATQLPAQDRREPTIDGGVTTAPEGAAPVVEPQTRGDVSPAAMTEAARDLAAGAPGRQTVSEVEQPALAPATARPGGEGPLSRVMGATAPEVAPLSKLAGQRVTITDEMSDTRGSMTGVVVAQDADGILFRDETGYDQLIENKDITSGKVSVAPAAEQPVVAQPAPEAQPAPVGRLSFEEALAAHPDGKFIPSQEEGYPNPEWLHLRNIYGKNPSIDIDGALAQLSKEQRERMDATGVAGYPDSRTSDLLDDEDIAAGKVASENQRASNAKDITPSESATPDLAEQASATIQPTQKPAERDLSEMSEEELRGKLKFIAQQGKANGWNKLLTQERAKVEKAINALSVKPAAEPSPVAQNPSPEPIEDKEAYKEPKRADEATMKRLLNDYSMTSKAMQAKIDMYGLNDTHEVAKNEKDRFIIVPKGVANAPQAPAPKRDAARRAEKKSKAAEQQPAENRQGEVGMKLAAGEVVTTTTGRQTTPFPKIDATTNRQALNVMKRVNQWLMDNAIAEAKSRGDDFNARSFEANRDKPSQADKDSAEHYLFHPDFSQPVPRQLLKPLTANTETTNAAQEGLRPEDNQQQRQDGNGGGTATEAGRSDSNVGGGEEQAKTEVTAQTTEVEHQDAGESAEDATQTVVNETVAKAAVAEKLSPSQMRDWLVAEIDKAIAKAAKPDPTIATTKPHTSRGSTEFYAGKGNVGESGRIQVTVREGRRGWEVYASNGNGKYGGKSELIYSFDASGPAAARKAAEVLLDRAYLDEDGNTKIAEAKTVTFDVPGDGKFNVVNSAQALTAFRDRVMKSPGFKDSRASGKAAMAKPVSAAPEPAAQDQTAEATPDEAESTPTTIKSTPVAEQPAPPTVSENTVFTQDAYEAAKARFKARHKGTQFNSGIDPEDLRDGLEMAGFHIEKGARTFAAYAEAMLADLGENIRPYLKSWYLAVKFDPRAAAFDGMNSAGDVEAFDVDNIAKAGTEAAQEPSVSQEDTNAGPAIYETGSQPLEEVAPENDEGDAGGRDAERPGAGSEQTGGGTDRLADGERPAKARGRGNRPARNNPAPAGEVAARKPRKAKTRAEKIEEGAKEEPALFELSPDIVAQTAPADIPSTDFVLTDEMAIGRGTEGEKYADNIAAIRTLKKIEAENRRATPEEKQALARYVGWGGLKNAFRVAGSNEGEGVAKGWEKRVAELEELLTPAELKAARNSTGAAHYTSPTVVKAMWRAVKKLGFAGGAVLEPSVGSGNFLGFMPEALRGNSDVFAVEYDSLTARIAQALYPNMDVLHSGIQNVPLSKNQFALAIGNPPFGREKLYFRFNAAANGRSIHNQFFIVSLDAVHEGGIMSMVVSHNLMDAMDNSARLEMAARAEFVGAIRLPDTAFKENARTEVVTDIIFFRKRTAVESDIAQDVLKELRGGKVKDETKNDAIYRAVKTNIEKWTTSRKIMDPAGSGEEINANGYFLENPGMVVGSINATGTMNRRAELNVTLENPAEFEDRLNKAIARLPELPTRETVIEATRRHYKAMAEGMRLAVQRAEPGAVRQTVDGALKTVVDMDAGETSVASVLREIDLTANTPFNPSYNLNLDSKWQRVENVVDDKGKPVKIMKDGKPTRFNEKKTVVYEDGDIPEKDRWGEKRIATLRDMLPIRNLLKRQLQLEMQDAKPSVIEDNRAKLNAAYDAFADKHGDLHKPANAKIALTMPDGGLIMAVENLNKDGKVSKAAIMTQRVTQPPKPIDKAKDASDAIAITLAETGRIDLERVAALLGTDEAGAAKALSEGEDPRAFYDPELSRWEPADLYLSGLVRKKLNAAKEAGLDDNVKALAKVIPEDWDSSQIVPNIGSAWIPADIYADFIKFMGYGAGTAHYSAVTNTFTVSYAGNPDPQWMTSGAALSPGEIMSRLLNSQPIKVTFKDRDGKTHVNEEATAESQAKANEIFNEFLDWAYQDDTRRERMVRIFNDKYNTRVVRQRDGSHLTLPGKVPDTFIKMRRHQNNAIWRGITDRAVLYDHVVGAGKTFTAIARIMERRRMGLSRKPMVVVPNHLIEQWAKDAQTLYPGANILAAGKEDFERENRRRLFARIAAGDYDMVIIGHSSFSFIDLDQATEERYLLDELRAAQAGVAEAEEASKEEGYSGGQKPMGVRDAERLVTKIEERLARLRGGKRDRLLTFEEIGVDDLTIDEAHEFKNLAYSSRLSGVSGMGNKVGSKKAIDLHMKVRSLHDRTGTSVAFLTGTPISNSVAEMYLVLRNLVPNEMREMGIDNFDAWRSMYVSYASAYEPTEAGGVKEVTRLGREWMNMKSLMDLYYSVSDAVTLEDIKKAYAEDNAGRPFPVPLVRSKVEGKGDREMVAVKPSPEQRAILAEIVAGFEGLKYIANLKERSAKRLRLMDRARKISLDPRAVDPTATVTSEGGKIGAIVDRVAEIHKRTAKDKGTQIIFLDRSVPKAKGDEKIVDEYDDLREKLRKAMENGDEDEENNILDKLEKFDPNEIEALRVAIAGGWNAYAEIKSQLVARGVPEDEIRFVQEANNDDQKAALFERVRNGEVRVLIGSTPRMGAGTNVQDRLVALHHGDVTWKPSDIEQREGRIVRQGNELLEKYGPEFAVDVIAYATEMTVDAKMWSLNATKLKSINGIRKYDGSFNMEFEDEESASMAEMAALATGNPLMVERVVLTGEIQKLEIQERSFTRRKNAIRDNLNATRRLIQSAPAKIADYTGFAEKLDKELGSVRKRAEGRGITVQGKTFSTPDDAMIAAQDAVATIRGGEEKARFSIDVGGEKLTSMDAIDNAIRKAFGTYEFEASVDGKPSISVQEVAAALMGKVKGKLDAVSGDPDFTIDGIQINGVPVEIDVGKLRIGSNFKDREISFAALNDAGKEMAGYRSIANEGVITVAGIRAGLEKIVARLDPKIYREEAKRIERGAEESEREIPGLEKEIAKSWPLADDLRTKRDRLQEVTQKLAQTSDAGRLQDPAEAPAEEPKASIGHEENELPDNVKVINRGNNWVVANEYQTVRGIGKTKQEAIDNYFFNVENGREINLSIGQSAGMSPADLRDTLTRGADGAIIKAVLDSGKVVIEAAGAGMPAGAQAATMPDGTIRLVASNLDASTARGVLLHEVFHSGAEALVGQDNWKALLRRVQTAADNAKPGSWMAEAKARAEAANTPAANMAEEIAAYAIENAENAPAGIREVADRIVGAVKAYILRRFGKQFGAVTPGQLRSLAVAALRSAKPVAETRTENGIRFSVGDQSSSRKYGPNDVEEVANKLADMLRERGANVKLIKAESYRNYPGEPYNPEKKPYISYYIEDLNNKDAWLKNKGQIRISDHDGGWGDRRPAKQDGINLGKHGGFTEEQLNNELHRLVNAHRHFYDPEGAQQIAEIKNAENIRLQYDGLARAEQAYFSALDAIPKGTPHRNNLALAKGKKEYPHWLGPQMKYGKPIRKYTTEGNEGPENKYSIGRTAGAAVKNGGERADLTQTLTDGKYGKFISNLLDAGNIVIHESTKTVPGFATQRGPVQATVTPDGKKHLVASNLNANTALGVLFHEIFHSDVKGLIGQDNWSALLRRLKTAAANPKAGGWVAKAKDRAAQALVKPGQTIDDVNQNLLAEEIGAYAIEDAENAPAGIREIADRLVGAVKAFILRKFGKQLGQVTPGQLRALAIAALRSSSVPQSVDRQVYSNGPMKGFVVYHGSPYSFDKFSLEKIGTGEGAQAYGHGLYFAENESVAKKIYRDALGGKIPSEVRAALQKVDNLGFDSPKIALKNVRNHPDWMSRWDIDPTRSDAEAEAAQIISDHVSKPPSSIYQVRINADTDNFLDWDKTLNEQTPKVQQALASIPQLSEFWRPAQDITSENSTINNDEYDDGYLEGPDDDRDTMEDYDWGNKTAAQVYEQLSREAKREGSGGQEYISRIMRDAGIDGIKYLDGVSRRAGEGSRNYVVFDESILEIENKYSIASTTPPAYNKKSVVQRANDIASDFLTQAMVGGGWKPGQFSSLALTPVRALFTELADGLPSAQTYLDTKQAMDAFRNEMNTADDALLQDWLKWGRKNKEANSSLMDVMHDSTLVQYDPTLTDAEAKSKGQTVDRGVKDAYAALPDKAKEFYAKIRDAYAQRSKAVEDQVVANVQKASTMILRNAQRAYEAEIERIKDDGLTGKAKADAEKAAQDKLKMAQTRLARNKAARIKRMRQYFESNRLKGPYFPLARFGNYFVTLRDADGKVLSFEKFSGRSAQRARAEELRGLYGIDAVQESTAQYEEKGARAVDPGFLASVDTILDEAGVDMGVRDAIYQTYLETMPDLSMRKAQIHRKGTAGFDSDAVRGFAHNMFHSAYQLSRLRFGMDLQDHLAEAAKQSRQGTDTVRKQSVYSEMAKSHQFTMNPDGSPLAHHVTSAVFLWTMAFNLSTAMVNTLQSVNVGIPNIAYDVDTSGKAGIRMASKAMAQAAVDFVRGKGTVLDSDKLTTDERAAVNAAYASGLIDSTQAHDLAGVSESGVNYRPGWQRFMRAASLPMHQTERFNREITFLAAYRVARKADLDHVAAIKKAEDQTWKTHFDNQSNAKPRFTRGQLGKMLFALKSYQANFVFRIFRDLHQALQGKTETERNIAFKRFRTMFLLTSAAAGVRGAFFYSTVMAIAGAFMGLAGKDDDDPDEIVRKFVIEHIPDAIIGHAVSGMILDGIPGYFTGTSLTNRVGMQDMWFHTNDRDLNADQQWTEWTTQALGAGAGIARQAYMGYEDIAAGNVQRGIEKMLPSSIRNVAKAARYATDGVDDKYGNPIVDNVPWRDVFKQALGFTPAEIADRFARNTYQNNTQNRIEKKASDARKAVARAMIAGDQAAETKARREVDRFNDRYPEYQIRSKSIMQSMRNMERRSGRMENGVELNPKLRDRIEGGTAPSIYGQRW